MTLSNYRLLDNGDAGVTIVFAAPSSEQLSRKILSLAQALITKYPQQFTEVIPAYQSLTLYFDPLQSEFENIVKKIPAIITALEKKVVEHRIAKVIRLPVCYEAEFAPDLQWVAKHCRLSESEIIRLHCRPRYLVHMLGFLPGFLYLGGLDNRLNCPRKNTPAMNVKQGAIAITGIQTGIYPVTSPGGWQVIGQTPVDIFKPAQPFPFIAKPLDYVEFYAIEKKDFLNIKISLENEAGVTGCN